MQVSAHNATLGTWLIAVSLAVALLAGCATPSAKPPPGSYRSETLARLPAGSKLLILHVPASTPAFRPGDPIVVAALTKQLTEAGYRVGLVPFDDYRLLVRDELASLGSRLTGDQAKDIARAEAAALPRLARIGGSTEGAALLISSRLVLREAELWQSHATWDGQTRAVQFKGTKATLANIQGTGPGLSIELLAHNAEGRLQFRWYGGASLPYMAGGVDGRNPEPREDLFHSGVELEQGVRLALRPLLSE